MSIDYTKTVLNYLEPKVGYFGFKYNEGESYLPTGEYVFTRVYWGVSQSITIGRVEYEKEELEDALKDGDALTEVPKELVLIKEPEYRLWLSNKYIRAVLSHNGGSMSVRRDGVGIGETFIQVDKWEANGSASGKRKVEKMTEWWEFSNETTLIQRLNEIYIRIINDGLDWFERQVADTKRYHIKLDSRRATEVSKKRKQNSF